MLYFLVPAMYPRFMITLDEELNNLPVTVRVGQVRFLNPVRAYLIIHLPGGRSGRPSG